MRTFDPARPPRENPNDLRLVTQGLQLASVAMETCDQGLHTLPAFGLPRLASQGPL